MVFGVFETIRILYLPWLIALNRALKKNQYKTLRLLNFFSMPFLLAPLLTALSAVYFEMTYISWTSIAVPLFCTLWIHFGIQMKLLLIVAEKLK